MKVEFAADTGGQTVLLGIWETAWAVPRVGEYVWTGYGDLSLHKVVLVVYLTAGQAMVYVREAEAEL